VPFEFLHLSFSTRQFSIPIGRKNSAVRLQREGRSCVRQHDRRRDHHRRREAADRNLEPVGGAWWQNL